MPVFWMFFPVYAKAVGLNPVRSEHDTLFPAVKENKHHLKVAKQFKVFVFKELVLWDH